MHKQRYFKDFLKRTVRSREELLKIIKDNEVKIRRCYSGTFNQQYCSEEFLLDAIFIIELFLKVRYKNVKEAEEAAKKTNCLGSLLPSRKEEKEAKEEREAEAKRTNFLRSLLPSLKEGKEAEEEKDYILRKPWLDIGIYYDLMLLENQLPFFVLEELYMFAFNIDSSSSNHHKEGKRNEEHKEALEKEDAFIMLSRNYFEGYDKQRFMPINIGKEDLKHFTDLIRYFFCTVPDQLEPEENLDINQPLLLDLIGCATELDDAGLKFKAAVEKRSLLDEARLKFKAVERRLLDITFPENKCLNYFPCLNLSWLLACLPCFKCFPCLERMQCILEVQPFEIYDSNEALFRNLMALEQCHYPFNAYICNYVKLLDYLIDTEKNVKLLVNKKIIINMLGSNAAVATMINNLSVQIPEGNSRYAVLGHKINEYRDNHWNRIMAILKSTYFRDFWRGSTTVVGLIVLGFTFWRFIRLYV